MGIQNPALQQFQTVLVDILRCGQVRFCVGALQGVEIWEDFDKQVKEIGKNLESTHAKANLATPEDIDQNGWAQDVSQRASYIRPLSGQVLSSFTGPRSGGGA